MPPSTDDRPVRRTYGDDGVEPTGGALLAAGGFPPVVVLPDAAVDLVAAPDDDTFLGLIFPLPCWKQPADVYDLRRFELAASHHFDGRHPGMDDRKVPERPLPDLPGFEWLYIRRQPPKDEPEWEITGIGGADATIELATEQPKLGCFGTRPGIKPVIPGCPVMAKIPLGYLDSNLGP